MITPIATPTIGCSKWGESHNVAPIIPTLRKIGAAAGAAKCLRQLSTPIKKATRLTRKI
jgi:hypothetical protein